MTFPDRVFGRRFTIWEGRGTALESGVAPKLQKPLTALRQEGRCSGIVEPLVSGFILLQSGPEAVINPKGRINHESC